MRHTLSSLPLILTGRANGSCNISHIVSIGGLNNETCPLLPALLPPTWRSVLRYEFNCSLPSYNLDTNQRVRRMCVSPLPSEVTKSGSGGTAYWVVTLYFCKGISGCVWLTLSTWPPTIVKVRLPSEDIMGYWGVEGASKHVFRSCLALCPIWEK